MTIHQVKDAVRKEKTVIREKELKNVIKQLSNAKETIQILVHKQCKIATWLPVERHAKTKI